MPNKNEIPLSIIMMYLFNYFLAVCCQTKNAQQQM